MSMMATRRTAPRAPPRSAAATPTQLLLVRSVCRLMSSWRHADLTATKRATHVLTDLAKNYKNRCNHLNNKRGSYNSRDDAKPLVHAKYQKGDQTHVDETSKKVLESECTNVETL
uniref:Uncharacterized protein n=1 Tax=Zea mays TaxID=4577 RepID=A0A804PC49_MAIZE